LISMASAVLGVLIPAVLVLVLMVWFLICKAPLMEAITVVDSGDGDHMNETNTRNKDDDGANLFSSLAAMQEIFADHAADDAMRCVKRALDKASTNMMLTDNEDKVVYMNNAFARMMQRTETDLRCDLPTFRADALLGRTFLDIYPSQISERQRLSELQDTCSTKMHLGGHAFHLVAEPVLDDRGQRLGTQVEWIDRTLDVAVGEELGCNNGIGHAWMSARLNRELN
jgi:methyl-accepting chemotaxis protein